MVRGGGGGRCRWWEVEVERRGGCSTDERMHSISLDIKAGRLELMPLTFGFPLFSEAIQVCYPERKLSRRVPPRCPSPKPSSWEGRLRG